RQNLPDRLTGYTQQTHRLGHRLAGLRPQHALAVIVHVQPCLPASGAGGRPIAVRITEALLVRGVVGDLFGDEGAAFLRWTAATEKGMLGTREEGVDSGS